ncbi:PQQ-binding-like beta-propeller repeat protein [Nocardia sp. CA-145437]|uniref:outer membrane protein assembly factor BamB family protein n=1 Tax=Nocardia sp. CA-145437 TaxID=3239980 RepID=UPI003D9536B2
MTAESARTVGPYRVIGRLGSGGMGEVLLGRSPGGRQVALKVVHRHLARDSEFRARFAREIQAARAVGGFYTAAVVDADCEAAQPWLATDFIAGLSLKHVVTDFGPLPEASVEELAAGVVEALLAIHEAGVTHRDLTPGNVLLTESGPRVIDFGIAKLVAETQSMTATGSIIGTPGYMSPEHVLDGEVGPAGDVFSLGSVLTFAATGHGPFEDKTSALVMMRVAHNKPDLGGLREGRLYRIITACLHKDPDARPSTADLLAALADHRSEPSPTGWLPPPMLRAVAVPPAIEPLEPARPMSRRTVVVSAVVGAAAVLAGSFGAGRLIVNGVRSTAPAAVASPGGALRWKSDIGAFVGADRAVDPVAADANSVYAGSIDGSLYALDIGSGATRWKSPMQQELSHGPVMSGGKVFATNINGLFAFDATTGARLWSNANITGAVAADGGLVFGVMSTARGDGIVAYDAATGVQRWNALGGEDLFISRVSAADGVVATVTGRSQLCALDAATGAERWRKGDAKLEFSRLETPVIADSTIFMAAGSAFRAFDLATGAEKWKFDHYGGFATTVRSGTVSIVDYDRAYGFDVAEGTVRWLYRADEPLSVTIAAGTDSVYVVTAKVLHALDSATGEQRWSFTAPDKIGRVTFGSGSVFLSCDDRNVYALTA